MSKYTMYRASSGNLVSIEKDNDLKIYKFLADYGFIKGNLTNLLGRILTIIDASISEKVQNKAVKDIIRGEFIDEYVHLSNSLCNQDEMDKLTKNFSDEEIEEMQKKAISLDEVAGH